MDLITLACVVLGLIFAASVPYLLIESRWRWRWQEVTRTDTPANIGAVDGGVYRSGGVVPVYLRCAPVDVRRAAFSCLLFGQLFVPGLMVGGLGLFASGLGILSLPGLITSAKLYRAGVLLLSREPREAYHQTVNAAAWSLWLHTVLLLSSWVLAGLLLPMTARGWVLVGALDTYVVVSMLQALYLIRVAARSRDLLVRGSRLIRVGAALLPPCELI